MALSTALAGAGGYGKTTLAQALCADQEIRQAYEGGVYWIELGRTPNILVELGRLYRELTGAVLPTTDEVAASGLVGKQFAGNGLLVIDDAWQQSHLKPFLEASPGCARLITTRNVDTLDVDVQLVRVDEMLLNQSVEVLLEDCGQRPVELQPVRDLALRLGRWALLLNLANGAIRKMLRRRDATIASALEFVARAYQSRGLEAFDASDAAQRNDAAAKSITLSVDLLEEPDRLRYLE